MGPSAVTTRNVFLAFGLVALSFFGSSVYISWRNLGIDARTAGLLTNSLPSIQHLDAACDGIRDIEVAAEAVPELPFGARAEAVASLESNWQIVRRELAAYEITPDYEGEEELYAKLVPGALEGLRASDSKLRARVEAHDDPAARDVVDRELRPASRRAIASLRQVMALNSTHAYEEVRYIAHIRKSADGLALALDSVAIFVGILAALWVLRVFGAHSRLLDAHSALVEQRASDLEQFGGACAMIS